MENMSSDIRHDAVTISSVFGRMHLFSLSGASGT